MQKAIDLVKKIRKNPDQSWMDYLEEINLHMLFRPVFLLPSNIETLNKILCYIVLAYDNDSSWLNINQDRKENKLRILSSLEVDTSSNLFVSIMQNEHDEVNKVIIEYLIEQTTWEWQMVMSNLDYSQNMLRFVMKKTDTEKTFDQANKDGQVETMTEEYDITKITKVNKEKDDLLKAAADARARADEFLAKIKAKYVKLDHAVQQDFNFEMTDEKNIDPMSWKQFIEHRNRRLAVK